MNKYFSAALCCGLLFAAGKSYSSGTELLEQLSREKIIGTDSVNPFSAPEATPSRPDAPSKATPALPKVKPVCVADTTPRQLAAKDALNAAVAREKIARLNADLQKANDHLASLNQQLAAVEQQKAALEKAATAQRERPAPAGHCQMPVRRRWRWKALSQRSTWPLRVRKPVQRSVKCC
ncbi:hypothetical protein PAS25_06045 [Leclercia adecarboxylata]|uniref:hypothetical protein n=1 Tax=Leclercia adecarboxylata TaxID=83655 RepID=UPI001117FBC5|nr:hypothetical protein [Leclercia adecarboxylata]QCZ26291.1 hypothetical protein FHN83_06350 [Leclercia adecarboxylata]